MSGETVFIAIILITFTGFVIFHKFKVDDLKNKLHQSKAGEKYFKGEFDQAKGNNELLVQKYEESLKAIEQLTETMDTSPNAIQIHIAKNKLDEITHTEHRLTVNLGAAIYNDILKYSTLDDCSLSQAARKLMIAGTMVLDNVPYLEKTWIKKSK